MRDDHGVLGGTAQMRDDEGLKTFEGIEVDGEPSDGRAQMTIQ